MNSTRPEQPGSPGTSLHAIHFAAWLALVAGLVATGVGWHLSNRRLNEQNQLRLAQTVDQNISKLRERLLLCEPVVHGAQGLYAASKSVERSEWRVYGQGLFEEKDYLGIRALLSISFVSHTNLASFLKMTRDDEAPDFAVKPAGEREDYCPIKFIQSKRPSSQLVGQDVGLMPALHESLMAARDSARLTLTSPLRLTALEGDPPEALLILPVYRNGKPNETVEQRRSALEGWVAAVLPVADFAAGLAASEGSGIDLQIFDDDATNPLLYESSPASRVAGATARPALEKTTHVSIGGRTWRVVFRTGRQFASATERAFPFLVLASGCLGSLLLFYLLSSLGSTRASALKMAVQAQKRAGRLQTLFKATKSIAEEKLDTRVPVESSDEIGLLAESFNHMAAELQKSKANDEARVREIQRMVESVRSSRNFFHSLVESLPLYLFRKDTDGRYVFVNALACERLDKSMEDILGLTDGDFVERGVAEKWEEQEAIVKRDGTTLESDEMFTGSDGVPLHFHVIRSPVFNQNGNIVGIQGIVMDITARKQVEQELTLAQARLVDASRQAGMAEVATGVLHNVGNVLNSVNISAALVVEQLRKSKTASLARAVKLISEHKEDVGEFLTNDPKGKQLPTFLEAVSEHLTREQAILTKETQSLQQNIDHIKQIVAMQQSYAKVSGALEIIAPHELVEDALRMSSTALTRNEIEVVRQFNTVPPVLVDRHKALQILINLVSNAKQAMDQRPDGRRLTLRIAQSEDGRVLVEVTDNGMGIAEENLARIFHHGFTTKKSGHGFGLHSGANAAKEMGGSLAVQSDGPGKGATFILAMPILDDLTKRRAA